MEGIGFSDFDWLKDQALDGDTLTIIEKIEKDEINFREHGIKTRGDDLYELKLKQGIIWTKRSIAHSLAHVFTQMFYADEHTRLNSFKHIEEGFVIDIGANEGYYLLKLLKLNPLLRAIAIEPNPIALEFLEKNVSSNGLEDRVKIIPKAVWSNNNGVELQIVEQVTSIGSVSSDLSKSHGWLDSNRIKKINVESITLRDIIESLDVSKGVVLKIDTEGAEKEILEASPGSLGAINRIVTEYHSKDLRNDVVQLLQAHGFELVLDEPDRPNNGDIYLEKKTKGKH